MPLRVASARASAVMSAYARCGMPRVLTTGRSLTILAYVGISWFAYSKQEEYFPDSDFMRSISFFLLLDVVDLTLFACNRLIRFLCESTTLFKAAIFSRSNLIGFWVFACRGGAVFFTWICVWLRIIYLFLVVVILGGGSGTSNNVGIALPGLSLFFFFFLLK